MALQLAQPARHLVDLLEDLAGHAAELVLDLAQDALDVLGELGGRRGALHASDWKPERCCRPPARSPLPPAPCSSWRPGRPTGSSSGCSEALPRPGARGTSTRPLSRRRWRRKETTRRRSPRLSGTSGWTRTRGTGAGGSRPS